MIRKISMIGFMISIGLFMFHAEGNDKFQYVSLSESDIGSMTWVDRFSGHGLRFGEKAGFISSSLSTGVASLFELVFLTNCKKSLFSQFDSGEMLNPPDTAAIQIAMELLSAVSPAFMLNHAARTAVWTEWYIANRTPESWGIKNAKEIRWIVKDEAGDRFAIETREAIWMASLLHDIGMDMLNLDSRNNAVFSNPNLHRIFSSINVSELKKRDFTYGGAKAAEAIGQSIGWPRAKIEMVMEAITLNPNMHVEKKPELMLAWAMNQGVVAEATKLGPFVLDDEKIRQIENRYDRLGFSDKIRPYVQSEAKRIPNGRFDILENGLPIHFSSLAR